MKIRFATAGDSKAARGRRTISGPRSAASTLALIVIACHVGGCSKPALYCGNTVTTGDDTFLLALVARGEGMFETRVPDVEVSFHAGGKEIGRARTDSLGFALAIGRIPTGVRTFEARALLNGEEATSQGRARPWERGRTIVVCDIDGTISHTKSSALVFKDKDTGSRPFPNSAETLRRLCEDYHIIYLTGRPLFLYDKTREWLDDNGFPEAPLLFASDFEEATRVESYKREMLRTLKTLYPNALIGIGNQETDAEAYLAERLVAIMVDDGEGRRFPPEVLYLRDWNRIGKFFDANNDVLTDPEKLQPLVPEGKSLTIPK